MTNASQRRSETGPAVLGVKRALDVLLLFGEDGAPTLGVTEIAEKLGLSKAVVFRILTELRASGFVEVDADTHRYSFGPQVLTLGLRYLDGLEPRKVAHEAMVALALETGETATFSVAAGLQRVYIDQVTPDRDVKMVVQLGRPFPLHTGASSKAMLAWMPTAQRDEYLSTHDLHALTPNSITDLKKLKDDLVKTRSRGYAMSLGERDEGAASVAAPVFGHTGDLIGVISVSGPIERFRPNMTEAAVLLLKAVDGVWARLGYRGHKPAEEPISPPPSKARRAAATRRR